MHDQVVSGNIKPLEKSCDAYAERVICKEFFIVEPDNIIIIDMMSKMFVAYVLVGSIGRPAQPAQHSPQLRVVAYAFENQVVPALMNHIGSDYHSVRQEQDRQQVGQPEILKQADPANDVCRDRI